MIHIKNLKFGYQKRALLFADLHLNLEPGYIYGLLGKNGAGKSSLLQLLQGLHFPKAGGINILGYNPRERHPAFLADCFLISEDLHLPDLNIQTFVNLYAPFYPNFARAQFLQILEEFELDGKKHLRQLSLGQQKKALLAFGLATNARILLLDEPTNGLDIPSKKLFRSVLARTITDDRLFVLSTHQVRDLQSLIDSVIVLEQGHIIFQESLAWIVNHLQFSISHQEPYDSDTLYYERVPGGYISIRPLGQAESLEVDIEVLFNAVISHPESFYDLFNFKSHAE